MLEGYVPVVFATSFILYYSADVWKETMVGRLYSIKPEESKSREEYSERSSLLLQILGAKDKADNINEIEMACQPSAALPNDNGVSAKRRRRRKYKANKKAGMEADTWLTCRFNFINIISLIFSTQ
ncbi:hypothetical protein MtrunA17_Chr7g0227791 [Medicago truncatula]|uniref:Uncharacterized protein n=1 Tax=Medicago truncatula TaxID=3880 RepID=A0A396GVQ5_MEDTR|nr:hypothetical protein MtrunA17_Chr7g0227791 [Medicago truncatula]